MIECKRLPIAVWATNNDHLHPDVQWLVRHQDEIVRASGGRPLPAGKTRPILLLPNGGVRVEFVGTWATPGEARAECEGRIQQNQGDDDAE